MEVAQEVVTVTTAGSAGSASGSGSTGAMNGFLLDIYFAFHADAPATTDTTVVFDEPDNGNVLVLTNTDVSVLHAPRKQGSDAAGAAISGVYDLLPLNGKLTFTLAQCDALAGALVARVRYLRA